MFSLILSILIPSTIALALTGWMLHKKRIHKTLEQQQKYAKQIEQINCCVQDN